MATKTIGGLAAGLAGDLDDTALLPIRNNDSVDRKYTVAQLRTQINTGAQVFTAGATFAGIVTNTNAFFAGADSAFGWTGRSEMASPSDGVVTLWNDANADFGRLQLGGTTSAFPALKRAAAILQVRLADDSNFAEIMSRTIVIEQGADDGEAITVRSSDVAHGMTSITTTDTYGHVRKYSNDTGGYCLRGLTEDTVGLGLFGCATAESGTRSTAANGAVVIAGELKAGASAGNLSADRNILVVKNNSTTRFILDSDGDSHQDVGTAWTNFDAHDDIALLNLLSAKVTRRNDPLRESFGKLLRQNRAVLERAKLVTFNRDGHHFMNMSRLSMLTVGAVRQLASRLERIEQRLNLLPATV